MTDSYNRDTRTLRPGLGASTAPGEPPPAATAGADATVAGPAPEAGGVVAELRPYFPRMALGAALVILAELWWAGRKRKRERARERKWRNRRGRR